MAAIVTLNQDSPSVQYLCKKDKRLTKVISMVGPITYEPHTDNPFPFLIHEIIEQMLSIKAGAKIYGRFEELCAGQITPESISKLSVEEIKAKGQTLADRIMKRKDDFLEIAPDGTENREKQHLLNALLRYIGAENQRFNDGLDYVEDTESVEQIRYTFKLIFDVMEQSQHYDMMMDPA